MCVECLLLERNLEHEFDIARWAFDPNANFEVLTLELGYALNANTVGSGLKNGERNVHHFLNAVEINLGLRFVLVSSFFNFRDLNGRSRALGCIEEIGALEVSVAFSNATFE